MSLSKYNAYVRCDDIIHPWTESCVQGHSDMLRSSIIGCSKIYIPMYLIQLAFKLRKKQKCNRKMIKDTAVDCFMCIAMGVLLTTTFAMSSCILRYALGKYTKYSIVFLPGLIGGLSYIILNPKLRLQTMMPYSNATVESVLLKMSHSGLLPLNVYTETVFFMVTNACLMYASKLPKSNNLPYTWFFKPDDKGPCEDGKSFSETISKKIIKYFGIGLGFSVLNKAFRDVTILMPNNIYKLFNLHTLRPGLFASTYVAVYEYVVYGLNRYFQKDRPVFALPAGFLAGLAYVIEPNLTINLTVFINLIQLIYKLVDLPWLRRMPIDSFLFCLFTGILFHLQFFYSKHVSKVGLKFISMATMDKSTVIISMSKKFINI